LLSDDVKSLLGLRPSFFPAGADSAGLADSVMRIEPGLLGSSEGAPFNPTRLLDAFIAFVALERVLIIRGVALSSRGNLMKAFSDSIRIYAVVISHMWLYWVINRGMPAGISYLAYNAAAFGMWQVFSNMVHKGTPTSIGLGANVPLQIRWIHLFIADLIWVTLKVVLGLAALYATFIIFPAPNLTGDITLPNLPLLGWLFLLAGLLGSGLGMLLQISAANFPVIDAILEVLMWFLFVTSGIYESFVQLTPYVRDYFSLNPIMSVIEYGRVALYAGYPVDTLTLAYPTVFAFGTCCLGLMLRRQYMRVATP
jgi:ABC-type polysaccharide/polyol phosphate export permease